MPKFEVVPKNFLVMGKAECFRGIAMPLKYAGYWKASARKKFVVAIKHHDNLRSDLLKYGGGKHNSLLLLQWEG